MRRKLQVSASWLGAFGAVGETWGTVESGSSCDGERGYFEQRGCEAFAHWSFSRSACQIVLVSLRLAVAAGILQVAAARCGYVRTSVVPEARLGARCLRSQHDFESPYFKNLMVEVAFRGWWAASD